MKRNDIRMLFENRLHDPALHAQAAPMNEAHVINTVAKTLADVLFDNAWDVLRRERVQVHRIFDGKNNGSLKRSVFGTDHSHQR